MSRMQMIEEQIRYWAKESTRLSKGAQLANEQLAIWQERADDIVYAAFKSDPRFKWGRDLFGILCKAIIEDHCFYLKIDSENKWRWSIYQNLMPIAESVIGYSNTADAIAELIAYYDQFIEKKAAVNG